MNISNTIRTGRHCVFNMHAHLVFVTKYRRHVFTKKSLKVLAIIFEKVCHKFESSLIEFEGEKDHEPLRDCMPYITAMNGGVLRHGG